MFRIVRTSTLRELIAQTVELHDRAEHHRGRAETAEHTTTNQPAPDTTTPRKDPS